jgi:hypothetical protein
MARVLVPQNPRRYNHNPRGSSTAVVTMKANNPFERALAGPEGLRRVPGAQLPGMGFWGMGDDPAATDPMAAFNSAFGASATPAAPAAPDSSPYLMLLPGSSPQAPAATPAATDWSSAFAVPDMMQPAITPDMTPQAPATAMPVATTNAVPMTPASARPLAAPGATAVPTAPAGGGFNWGALTQGIVSAASQTTSALIGAKYPKAGAAIAAAAGKGGPVVPNPNLKPASSKTTEYVIIGGVVLAIGAAIYMIMRKKAS